MVEREPIGRIYGKIQAEQEIFSYFDCLIAIEIQVATYHKQLRGDLEAHLFDSRGRLVALARQDLRNVADNSRVVFWFSPIASSRGRRFRLKIGAPNLSSERPVTAWKLSPDREANVHLRCRIGGEAVSGGLYRRCFYAGMGGVLRHVPGTSTQICVSDVSTDEALIRQQAKNRVDQWIERSGITSHDRMLEVGCGFGELGREWALRCSQYKGLESHPALRRIARRRLAGIPGASIGEFEKLSEVSKGAWDVIFYRPQSFGDSPKQRLNLMRLLREKLSGGGVLLVDSGDARFVTGWKSTMGVLLPEAGKQSGEQRLPTKRLFSQIKCAGFFVDRLFGRRGHFELVCHSRDLYNASKFAIGS